MNNDVTDKIINLTKNGYIQISNKFSSTRNFPWPIFDEFLGYVKEGDTVLDIGCGNGRLLKTLDKKKVKYTGIDFNPNFIKLANQMWQGDVKSDIRFIEADATNPFPFKENSFDTIFCVATFNHIPSQKLQKEFLVNVKKLLKEDGYLIMTNWNLWQTSIKKKNVYKYFWERFWTPSKQWQEEYGFNKNELGFKDVFTQWKEKKDIVNLYYRAFTLNEIKKLSKKAGFNIVDNYYEYRGKRKSWFNGNNLITILKNN